MNKVGTVDVVIASKKVTKSFLHFRIDDSIETVNFIALNDESESKDYKNVIKIDVSLRWSVSKCQKCQKSQKMLQNLSKSLKMR